MKPEQVASRVIFVTSMKPIESRILLLRSIVGLSILKGTADLRLSSLPRSASSAMLPVRNPLPRGEYVTMPMPSSRSKGIKSFWAG